MIIELLRLEAFLVIKKYKPKIVAVTGSVGKTSTKDAVFNVLSQFYYTRKSEKNFNNDIGVPLTILGVPTGWRNPWKWLKNLLWGLWLIVWPVRYPEWLVVEVGIRKPGDMNKLARWLAPDIVVVTAFGELPSHVEFFDSKQAVWEEEASIIQAMKDDGLLVLNHDDQEVMKLHKKYHKRYHTFGVDTDATLTVSNMHIIYDEYQVPTGSSFRIEYEGNSIPLTRKGLVGGGILYTSASALLVAYILKLPMLKAREGLLKGELPRGRMRLVSGINETVILDDSYNSSPSALSNALDTLKEMQTYTTKIAVLGDMLDLGKYTEEAHVSKGKEIAQVCDYLITVGPRAKSFTTGALEHGMTDTQFVVCDTLEEAEEQVRALANKKDIILVKGSQGSRMEKLVANIMAEPEKKQELLVRQEGQWKHT